MAAGNRMGPLVGRTGLSCGLMRSFGGAGALGALIGAALLASGCGGAPRVSDGDARAVFGAVENEAQLVARQDCGGVSRPVSAGTRRAVALTIDVARKNPHALLPSPEFAGLEWRMSDYVADWAGVIEYCVGNGRRVHPSWRSLERSMDQAVAEMSR